MNVQEFIRDRFEKRLARSRVLTVYDPEGRYREIVASPADESTVVSDQSGLVVTGRSLPWTPGLHSRKIRHKG